MTSPDDKTRALLGLPPEPEEEKDVRVLLREQLVRFFESGDLYREYPLPGTDPTPRRNAYVSGLDTEDEFEVPTNLRIKLPCPTCRGADQTFAVEFDPKQMDRTSVDFQVDDSYMIRFGCTHCQGQRYAFLVHVGRTATQAIHLVKAGVWPSARPTPSPELAKGLGPAADLFSKGLMVKKFGYGIGAFAYYRRVTEDIIGRLLVSLRAYADEAGAEGLVAAIDATASETQASKRIAVVKDLVPKVLRPGGLNPLGTLYEALSDGIHGRTDEECLDRAEALRIAIEFLVTRLESLVATPKQFLEAIENLKSVEAKTASKATKPRK